MSDKRYNVTLSLRITDENGNEFFDSASTWTGLPYVAVVGIEELLSKVNDGVLTWGKERVKAK